MKPHTLILPALLLFLAGRSAAADTPPPALTVAVYDFTAADPEMSSYGVKATTLVTADLTTETNLVLVERAELDKALKEQAFDTSGMVSSDAAAKIGQITGAKILVAGQVMKADDNRLVLVASIIGTETGRLFAEKVDGPANRLLDLTAELSRKIAQTITTQTPHSISPPVESHEDHVERILKNIKGKSRPSVSLEIVNWGVNGHRNRDETAENELGALLLKAGFPVVDAKSDRKPDIELTGTMAVSDGPPRGALLSSRGVIELKIQERRTGNILGFDRQESNVTAVGRKIVGRVATVTAMDGLAERVLPLLAQ